MSVSRLVPVRSPGPAARRHLCTTHAPAPPGAELGAGGFEVTNTRKENFPGRSGKKRPNVKIQHPGQWVCFF